MNNELSLIADEIKKALTDNKQVELCFVGKEKHKILKGSTISLFFIDDKNKSTWVEIKEKSPQLNVVNYYINGTESKPIKQSTDTIRLINLLLVEQIIISHEQNTETLET